jgi:hypothetical protein
MLAVIATALLVTGQAAEVPLPRPRAAIPQVAVETPHGPPTECDRRLSDVAEFELKPNLEGPSQCGAQDLVELRAVRLADRGSVAVQPPAILRCEMAQSFSAWVREEVAPRLAATGGGLKIVQQDSAYECRNRNRAATGRLSEHAHGLAIDVKALVLADKHVLAPTDVNEPKVLRAALRETACLRFTTVLGPGEPAHDSHIHLDTIQRHGGYRICSWDVREPVVAHAEKKQPQAAAEEEVPPQEMEDDAEQAQLADVPLPRARPRRVARSMR